MDAGPEQRGRHRRAATCRPRCPCERPDPRLAQLPLAARQAFERRYATVEITDSVAMMGGHQVALVRGYHDRLQQAVQELQGDVLNDQRGYHEMTAILDKIAAGELLARRQDMASNQLLSHALEQLLARSKRLRDTEAATHEHAARHVAGRPGGQRRVRAPAPATRSARGGSRRSAG